MRPAETALIVAGVIVLAAVVGLIGNVYVTALFFVGLIAFLALIVRVRRGRSAPQL